MAASTERDLGLRDNTMEIYEVVGVNAWYFSRRPGTGKLQLYRGRGNVIIERDPIPPHDRTAKFIPDIFVENLVSDVYTESVPKTGTTQGWENIPQRYYIGFGRAVSPDPNTVKWGTVWTDGTNSPLECLDTLIHYLEDFMLDGDRPIEYLEELIEQIGREKEMFV